jgi:hypothetical protein
VRGISISTFPTAARRLRKGVRNELSPVRSGLAMRKLLLILAGTLGLAALIDSGLLSFSPGTRSEQKRAPQLTWSGMRSILLQEQELEERRQGMLRFRRTLTETKATVLSGSVSLHEAADRVIEAAQHDNPCFLKGVARSAPGASTHERVSRVLLAHFRVEERHKLLTDVQLKVLNAVRQEWEASGG